MIILHGLAILEDTVIGFKFLFKLVWNVFV